jgi:uncharacterized protein (DUF2141 family)
MIGFSLPALFLLPALLAGSSLQAQNKVTALVSGFESDKGVCRACLFNSEESFKKERPILCQEVVVGGRKAQVTFADVPNGTYALFVFHDVNRNGKMDTNFLGIPKEGYGASGNKLPFAAAPRFDANKFTLGGSALQLSIRLRNI